MSEASYQRSVRLGGRSDASSSRPTPRGYGLLAAAAASLGLWAGIIWIVLRAAG